MKLCQSQLCLTLCDPMGCSPPGSSVAWNSPGKNTGVHCHALLQGIFPTQESNPGLLHCRWILYCLIHQGCHLSRGISIKLILERLPRLLDELESSKNRGKELSQTQLQQPEFFSLNFGHLESRDYDFIHTHTHTHTHIIHAYFKMYVLPAFKICILPCVCEIASLFYMLISSKTAMEISLIQMFIVWTDFPITHYQLFNLQIFILGEVRGGANIEKRTHICCFSLEEGWGLLSTNSSEQPNSCCRVFYLPSPHHFCVNLGNWCALLGG